MGGKKQPNNKPEIQPAHSSVSDSLVINNLKLNFNSMLTTWGPPHYTDKLISHLQFHVLYYCVEVSLWRGRLKYISITVVNLYWNSLVVSRSSRN